MYIRTEDGKIVDVSLMQECETDDDNGKRIFDGYEDKDGTYYPVENIIKKADSIRGLIMKGDLVFAKDRYTGVNAAEHPSIANNDIDKCTQYFEYQITKFYIELSNGDYHLVAKEKRGELELL